MRMTEMKWVEETACAKSRKSEARHIQAIVIITPFVEHKSQRRSPRRK